MRALVRWLPILALVACRTVGEKTVPADDAGATAVGVSDTGTAEDGTTHDTGEDIDPNDRDGDGFPADVDCDDEDPKRFPAASETCNGIDDNCDGEVDNDARDADPYHVDEDGDGFGDPNVVVYLCVPTDGFAQNPDDCDDTDASARPGAVEVCDGDDDDCDGEVDEEDAIDGVEWYLDADGDGFGRDDISVLQCNAPEGYVDTAGDCDDSRMEHHPDADEVCDGDDNNCDGVIDEDTAIDASTWYIDSDTDGFGDPITGITTCTPPSGTILDGTDCDDTEAEHNPDASEVCDGNDNNCDGVIDESTATDASTWYTDSDGDTYGDADSPTVACDAPTGTVANGTDCDDASADHNPGASEVCDGDDDDCDGEIDEDSAIDASTWYPDSDGDTYGDAALGAPACSQPSGTVADGTDCDDTDADENPAADEICDGDDDDCDGDVDENSAIDVTTFYTDSDGDGFGDASTSVVACTAPSGTSSLSTDCDDTEQLSFPGAEERCWLSLDSDCDGDAGMADSDCAPDGTVGTTDLDRTISGPATGARLGQALVANADINGDGIHDLLVTSDDHNNGSAWVFLGTTSVASTPWSLSTADWSLTAGSKTEAVGTVAALGDITGDGLADVLLGDPGYDHSGDEGAIFAFYGAVTLPGTKSTSSADLAITTTEPGARLGAVATGDLDGDGIDELVAGASHADGATGLRTDAGRVGLFMGPVTGSLDLDDADRTLWGDHPHDEAGSRLSIVPDIDGDGLDDLVVVAAERDWENEDDGAVYVLYAAVDGDDGALYSADLLIRGGGDDFGAAVAGGDLNADGYGDLVIGVPGDDTADTDAGAVLVFPGPYGSGTRLHASDAPITLLGEARNDDAGESLAVGDVDGDGFADILVGAGDHDQGGTNSGAVYGLRGPVSGTGIDLGSADWEQEGSAGEGLGATLATGDLDGDGYADVVAASPLASGTYSYQGEVSVVLGGGRIETPTEADPPDLTADDDGDGYSEVAGDCDDTRATIAPDATEICGDDVDDDCDGVDPGCPFDALEDASTAWMAIHGDTSNRTGTVTLGGFDLNGDEYHDLAVGSPNDDTVSIWFGPLPEGPTRTGSPDLLLEGGYGTGEVLGRAGDFNGDGIDDLLVGAPDSDDTVSNGGAVYLLLGATDLSGSLSLPSDADFVFTPEAEDDALGTSVVGGTDLDEDGFDDIVFGATGAAGRASGEGAVYVVYGGRTAGTWSADTADHIFGGESLSDEAGASVSFAGDVNGDGAHDLLIGASDLLEQRGGAYLVFGPFDDGFTDLGTVRGRFVGQDYAGTTVAGVGDLNADGYDDIAIGAPGFTGSTASPVGTLYVFFGPLAPAHHELDDAPLVVEGDAAGDMMGLSVASMSGSSTDMDGDGYADLLVGAPYSDVYGTDAGAGWLYYGPFSAGTLGTADADVSFDGFISGYTGLSVDMVGDLDGDGYTDVALGAPNARDTTWSWVGSAYAGATYIWRGGERGSASVTPTLIDTTDDADGDGFSEDGGDCDDTDASVYPGAPEVCENDLDDDCDGIDLWCLASGAVSLDAEPSFQSGTNYEHGAATVFTDIDGDGFDDLVIGERASRTGATNGGQVYWMFGPLQRGEVDFAGARSPDRTLYGATRDDYVGGDVWVAGDIDRDGLDDLIVGAEGVGTGGAAYLIVGAVSAVGEDDIATTATTTIEAASSGDAFGTRVSGGDLNGDGTPDVVVTAPDSDDGATNAGTAYIFLGPITAGTLSATAADATISADTDRAGLEAVEVIRDTDGDGLDDLLLGAPQHEGAAGVYGTGAAWLFTSGPTAGALSVADADTTFDAEGSADAAGADVAGGGDLDGDGLAELLIGARTSSAGPRTRGGIAYLFYGGTVASGSVDLGTAATRFLATTTNASVGDGLGTAGDVDGDGLDDLLIGDPSNSELHLFRAPVAAGDLSLGSSDAALWPWGETSAGQVGHPGDQDGDGLDDIVVAAPDSLGRVWVSAGGID